RPVPDGIHPEEVADAALTAPVLPGLAPDLPPPGLDPTRTPPHPHHPAGTPALGPAPGPGGPRACARPRAWACARVSGRAGAALRPLADPALLRPVRPHPAPQGPLGADL